MTPADRVERFLDRHERGNAQPDAWVSCCGVSVDVADLRELVRAARLAEDRELEERARPNAGSCRECGYLHGSHSSACSVRARPSVLPPGGGVWN